MWPNLVQQKQLVAGQMLIKYLESLVSLSIRSVDKPPLQLAPSKILLCTSGLIYHLVHSQKIPSVQCTSLTIL